MKARIILRGLAICAVVWLGVGLAQKFFGSYRTTAESLQAALTEAALADWSQRKEEPAGDEAAKREEHLRGIAKIINELDFKEREKARDQRLAEDLFWKLSTREQILFVDLTIRESMKQWMEAFNDLPAEEKMKLVKKELEASESEMAAEDLERMKALSSEMLEKIVKEGSQAFFETADAETKMFLAPMLERVSERMQGLRHSEWDPGERE